MSDETRLAIYSAEPPEELRPANEFQLFPNPLPTPRRELSIRVPSLNRRDKKTRILWHSEPSIHAGSDDWVLLIGWLDDIDDWVIVLQKEPGVTV